MSNAVLSEITVYPIKSLGGVSVASATIEPRGLQFDRRWLLVDRNNRALTQRDIPQMATIRVQIESENLRVSAEGGEDLLIAFEPTTKLRIRVQIWSDVCDATPCDELINRWFSRVLNADCRLVFMPDEAQRFLEPDSRSSETGIVSFADAFPFLIVGASSLAELNSRLAKPVSMNRFRPNFVFENGAAFVEDEWRQIRIGETVFHAVERCPRCSLINVDQERGAFGGKDPLQTLARFRTIKSDGRNKTVFGQYLIAENHGATVSIGAFVEVLK